jgi:predicted CopG family antitoxin
VTDRTSIQIDTQTREALRLLKTGGDSYDDVIRRLLRDHYDTPAAEIVRNRDE